MKRKTERIGDDFMWEYLIVICMVTNFSGDPINKCYSKVSADKYPREKICEAAAKAEDYRMFYMLRDRNAEGMPLIRTFCNEAEEKRGTLYG